jgi:superfamily II DNA helicase RecQ/superfamily I DNA/RNA helicase
MESSLQHITFFLARLAKIWYVYDALAPQIVAQEALKQWHTPTEALTHLLQTKSLPHNVIYAACLLWAKLDQRDPLANPQRLRTLLAALPPPMQAEVFITITQNNQERMAFLLISFASPALPGLVSIAEAICLQWSATNRHDDLAVRFYRTLPAFGVAEDDVQWFVARALVARGQYVEAEPLLLTLTRTRSTPDVWWLLLQVLRGLRRPVLQLLHTYNTILTHWLTDARREQALQQAGTLYRDVLGKETPDQESYLQALRDLLALFPVGERATILATAIAPQDEDFQARLLMLLSTQPVEGTVSLVQSLLQRWQVVPRSDALAFQFYASLPAYGIPLSEVQLVRARACVAREHWSEAEQLLLILVKQNGTADILWLLALAAQKLARPAHEQFQRFFTFVRYFPADQRVDQALQTLGALQQTFLQVSKTVQEMNAALQTLRALLNLFPEEQRAQKLTLVVQQDDTFLAQALTALAAPQVAGLQQLACSLMERWSVEPRSDSLALQFYRILPAYGVNQEQTDFLLARAFFAREQYKQAEQLLQNLQKYTLSPDVLWLLADVSRLLHRPAQIQLGHLLTLTQRFPNDARAGQAWQWIGDLYGEQSQNGMAAVRAYQQAERLGRSVPQLAAYYLGDWQAIPALRTHQDAAFPVVVALDLEVDPLAGAQPGERVYEVAAVRMRGQTVLAEYHSYIQRSFQPTKLPQRDLLEQAPLPDQVAQALRHFIGDAFIVGHNLCDFDARHLNGMGILLTSERMLDTLVFARLLYPDSLHHHLALLCQVHGVTVTEGSWHTALPDARACGFLLHALGDELARRGGALLAGIRALVQPESAFDRVVLQPRHLGADPTVPWTLNPAPSPYRGLVIPSTETASPRMQDALKREQDALVELYDPHGAYCKYLPLDQRTLVTTQSQARLEQMLAIQHFPDAYLLPDPQTLLCPERMRLLIESSRDSQYRLLLFCLYQASHNHDLRTLYPFRLPDANEPELHQLRVDLRSACCLTASGESGHAQSCRALSAHLNAMQQSAHLFATHEALLHQPTQPKADLIVIDDFAELHMHLAEYVAQRIDSDHYSVASLSAAEQEAFDLLHRRIAAYVQSYAPQPRYHERIPLWQAAHFLLETPTGGVESQTVGEKLEVAGRVGRQIAQRMRYLCEASQQEVLHQQADQQSSRPPLQAYWLDAWFSEQQPELQRWAICGINENLGDVFQRICWQPYKRHILCGPAMVIGKQTETFFERSLGISPEMPRLIDERSVSTVYIPTPEWLPSVGFLSRVPWIRQVGRFISILQAQPQYRSLVVTLHQKMITEVLAQAFSALQGQDSMQVLAPSLGWTMAKIAERMRDTERATCTFVSPHLRHTYLDMPVDVEVTGPLHFLQQHDPLVAAHMRLFANLYPEDGPFMAYLLPQALLELKTRLSSPAQLHVILDSRLHTKAYRDEVFAMLHTLPETKILADIMLPVEKSGEQEQLITLLMRALRQRGLQTDVEIADEELHLVRQTFWGAPKFRTFQVEKRVKQGSQEETKRVEVSQKDIIRGVLCQKDQLFVAATGGGKSLCFQLPALLLAHEAVPKVTLVFSPLISLMTDQIDSLREKGIFSAITINSSLSSIQRQEHLRGLQRGEYSVVYLAPEQIRSPGLRKALQHREIGLVVLDEAHCLSQWGHDFRTDYFAVKDWLHHFYTGKQRPFPILALTATARQGYRDQNDQERSDQTSTVQDIIKQLELGIQEQDAIITSPVRAELKFRVVNIELGALPCGKCGKQLEHRGNTLYCLHCSKHFPAGPTLEEAVEKRKMQQLRTLLQDTGPEGLRSQWDQPLKQRMRGIVYCAYTKTTERVAEALRGIKGLRVDFYHAKRTSEEKDDVLRRFKSDEVDGLDLIVATSAFGMGIDVRRLGFVVHFDTPGTPEAYYQEAGRAGRDETFTSDHQALCILFYHPSDLNKQRYLSRKNSITRYHIEDVYTVLNEQRSVTKEGEVGNAIQEITMTTRDLAARAGVSENQVGMILYYLEYHTQLNGNQVLKLGEITANVLRVKFEPAYEANLKRLPPDSSSRPLLDCFLHSELFGLKKDTLTTLSLRELADTFQWPLQKVEREILNLTQRHIISYDCSGRINWVRDAEYAKEKIVTVQKNIRQIFNEMDKKYPHAFLKGDIVYEDIFTNIIKVQKQDETVLLKFLSTLSHSEMQQFRLLKRFTRTLRRPQVGRYEISLWIDERGEQPSARLKRIFDALAETVTFLEQQHIQEEGQEFDLLRLRPDYHARLQLHQLLLLLDILGIVRYKSDPSIGLALRITLKQPAAPAEQLNINLATLRLKEDHDKQKLKRMQLYAERKEDASKVFKEYFFGVEPLVERIDQTRRTDLIADQEILLRLENGLHLIEGPAGCGKTTVLVEYIKHLVYDKLVPIERIMVATHYNSATSRIAKDLEVLQENGNLALITTINRFGERIFRQYRSLLLRGDGVPYFEKDPVLQSNQHALDEKELSLVSRALATVHEAGWLGQESWPSKLEMPTLTSAYRRSDAKERDCLNVIRRFRAYGIFPLKKITKEMIVESAGKVSDEMRSLSYAAYIVFLRLLGQENIYTFDDQILFALAILQSRPEIVREYQHFYEYILVDELQDFTPAQVSLFLQLCHVQRNVLAFGDRDQEIRVKQVEGASVFDQLARQDTCGKDTDHHLTVHFRSTQRILNLIDAIRNFGKESYTTLQSARNVKGAMPVMLHVYGSHDPLVQDVPSFEDGIQEVSIECMIEAVLQQMRQIPEEKRGSTAFMAFRSQECLSIERSLRQRGIAFSSLSKDSLYQLHHVKRVLVYLRLILEKDDDNLQFLLRSCVVPYFEYQQVKQMRSMASSTKRSLFDLLYERHMLDSVNATQDQRDALRQHLAIITHWQSTSMVDDVLKAIDALGPEGPIAVVKEQEQKYEELQEALKGLRGKTVKAAVDEMDQHIAFLEAGQKHAGLFVTTIDHAKSEEFDTVFIFRADYLKRPFYSWTIRTCKCRLYVATSRARERLYLVLSAHSKQLHPLLSKIPKTLYEDREWKPAWTEE